MPPKGADMARSRASVSQEAARSPLNEHIGRRIARRREALGLDRHELAHFVGMTERELADYETGRERISAIGLHEMAARLEVPVPFFFAGFGQQRLEKAADIDAAADGRSALIACYDLLDSRDQARLVEIALVLAGERLVKPRE